MPRCVKRPDIVKEILMFALWSLESKMFGKWSQMSQNLNYKLMPRITEVVAR